MKTVKMIEQNATDKQGKSVETLLYELLYPYNLGSMEGKPFDENHGNKRLLPVVYLSNALALHLSTSDCADLFGCSVDWMKAETERITGMKYDAYARKCRASAHLALMTLAFQGTADASTLFLMKNWLHYKDFVSKANSNDVNRILQGKDWEIAK